MPIVSTPTRITPAGVAADIKEGAARVDMGSLLGCCSPAWPYWASWGLLGLLIRAYRDLQGLLRAQRAEKPLIALSREPQPGLVTANPLSPDSARVTVTYTYKVQVMSVGGLLCHVKETAHVMVRWATGEAQWRGVCLVSGTGMDPIQGIQSVVLNVCHCLL